MPAVITAKEQTLVKVFSDDYLFTIPLYQRPYAWTTEEIDELLDDLTDAMGRDSDAPYFLGNVVLIKNDGDAKSEVVDGQQRLTTLTMLLCVLRDISESTKTANELNEFVCEVGSTLKGTQDRFRLSLRERDRKFFEDNVQNADSLKTFLQSDNTHFSDSQKQILENVGRLHRDLSKLDGSTRDQLATYVMQKCCLVVVSASDGDSAYRVFSVMNNRGLPLSPTDILKADIIGTMPIASQDKYTEQWETLEVGLGRDDFQDLFAHIRTIYRKDKLRGTLQKEFQEHVLGELNPEKAMQFIDDVLEPYAQVYQTISRASYESTSGADEVNNLLAHLGRLDNFDWIPPAMAYFHRNGEQHHNLIKFTCELERLAYGMFILRENINHRINRYADVIKSIENEEDLFAEDSPVQLVQAEKQGILAALNGDIYTHLRVRRPLLLRLDGLLAGAGATYNYRVITIEHVLPQHPSNASLWLKWFPDNAERAKWTNCLANLVLLSRPKNTQASNYEFEIKKSTYFQSKGVPPFALTTQVVNESTWTPEVLAERQSNLIDLLKKEWRLG